MYSCTALMIGENDTHPCSWNTNGEYITADCHYKNLNNIPCGLPSNATRLKLGYNRIDQLRMGELENLPRLQKLELDNNPLKSVDKFSFRELENLTEIRNGYINF